MLSTSSAFYKLTPERIITLLNHGTVQKKFGTFDSLFISQFLKNYLQDVRNIDLLILPVISGGRGERANLLVCNDLN